MKTIAISHGIGRNVKNWFNQYNIKPVVLKEYEYTSYYAVDEKTYTFICIVLKAVAKDHFNIPVFGLEQ